MWRLPGCAGPIFGFEIHAFHFLQSPHAVPGFAIQAGGYKPDGKQVGKAGNVRCFAKGLCLIQKGPRLGKILLPLRGLGKKLETEHGVGKIFFQGSTGELFRLGQVTLFRQQGNFQRADIQLRERQAVQKLPGTFQISLRAVAQEARQNVRGIGAQQFIRTVQTGLQQLGSMISVLQVSQVQRGNIKFQPEVIGILMQQLFAQARSFFGSALLKQGAVFLRQRLCFLVGQLGLKIRQMIEIGAQKPGERGDQQKIGTGGARFP